MSRPAFRAPAALLLVLLLSGGLLQAQAIELRCKCWTVVSNRISQASIASVVFTPEGPHCVNPEVVVTMKNGRELCVNPNMPWIKRIIQGMLHQRNNRL